jgi:hypothetical protein
VHSSLQVADQAPVSNAEWPTTVVDQNPSDLRNFLKFLPRPSAEVRTTARDASSRAFATDCILTAR